MEPRLTVSLNSGCPSSRAAKSRGLIETLRRQDPRSAVRPQDLLNPVDHGDGRHAAIHDPLQPRLDLQPRQTRESCREHDGAHHQAANGPLRRPPDYGWEAGNADRRRAPAGGPGRGLRAPLTPPLPQHPDRGQDEQRQRQAEEQAQAARQAEMERHRVRRGGRDQKGARGRHAAGHHAAAGASHRPAERVLERTAASQLLALPHEEVNGEVDAETEHGDAEERLHHRQLPRQKAHRAQSGAYGENQNRGHRQHAARSLLDDPEEKQHEHEADRGQALDRAQGLLLVARRQGRQAREARRHTRAGQRALDHRFEFEERAPTHLLRQRVRGHLDFDQAGAGHARDRAAKRQRGSRELGRVRKVIRPLGEGEPTLEQGPLDEPRRLLLEPVKRQRPASRGNRRQRGRGAHRVLDRVVEQFLLALEQHEEQAPEFVLLGHLEVAADVLVVTVHHPGEREIDRSCRQQRRQGKRRRDRPGDRCPRRPDRPARDRVEQLRDHPSASIPGRCGAEPRPVADCYSAPVRRHPHNEEMR